MSASRSRRPPCPDPLPEPGRNADNFVTTFFQDGVVTSAVVKDVADMDSIPLYDGSIPLHRCQGCTFRVIRNPGTFAGQYVLATRPLQPRAHSNL